MVGAACSLPDRVEIARFPTAFEAGCSGPQMRNKAKLAFAGRGPGPWLMVGGALGAGKNCTGHGSAKINI